MQQDAEECWNGIINTLEEKLSSDVMDSLFRMEFETT